MQILQGSYQRKEGNSKLRIETVDFMDTFEFVIEREDIQSVSTTCRLNWSDNIDTPHEFKKRIIFGDGFNINYTENYTTIYINQAPETYPELVGKYVRIE